MSVSKNIAFPLRMRKVPEQEIRKKVSDVLVLVQLTQYGDRFPAQLSGGQQQRVALARSIVFNPSVLLMDEPLGALDKKLREHMQLEIKHIQEELGITVIYVTHDQEEALTMSDRIAVMNLGRTVQVDIPSFLYEHPTDHFVADFIGESNFVHGIHDRRESETSDILRAGRFTFWVPRCETEPEQGIELIIRPEKIYFVDGQNLEPNTNTLRGRITEVIYVGENTRYVVETELNQSMVVKHPNRRGIQIRRKGDVVLLGWKPEDTSLVGKTG
jgi:ABC-type Fe3+/spermidine/putrescine transport system ATPase subunit